ncbi:hypothetical protein [Chryseolinea sp. H1M3-3]|uniref:hypothetical protein n=1 Tax=Chryseolinea sp. H1M3-3 TaxID=3034144 RepID=UPI0023EB1FE2|nr:hypothetical protein [Chryseolinea sp. H1M3-3]
MEFHPQDGAWCRHYSQQHYHPDIPVNTILLGKAIITQWTLGAAFAPKILTKLFNGI